MKYLFVMTLCLFIRVTIVHGQAYTYTTEGFESLVWSTPSLSYPVPTGTWTTSSTLVFSTSSTPNTTNGGSKCLNMPSGQYLTSPSLTDGAATLTFYGRSASSSVRLMTIYTSTDGINFNSIATANTSASSISYALITIPINNSNVKNVRISFPSNGSGAIDDINITGMSGTQYYNSTSADVTNVNNWWTNTDGLSGTHPPNFTSTGQTFNISHAGAVMNNAWSVITLVLGNSNTLSLNGNTLTLNGPVTGTGTLSAGTTSSLVINSAVGTLNFTPGFQTLKGCTLNTNASATLGTALDIAGGAAFGTLTLLSGAILNTGNNLTLKSSPGGTARVGQSTGLISGKVTVERYIPANGNRAWRLLSVPLVSTQSLHISLQEGQLTGVIGSSGLGTNISSSRSTWNIDGFDFSSNNDGLLTWAGALNNNAGGWAGVSSTNNLLSSDNGYMLYIRGDRNCTGQNTSITSTTIRMNGTLKVGNYPSSPIPIPASQFALIGNPYVSQIDFRNVTKTAGIDNTFYLWDPKLVGSSGLGAFQTLLYDGTNYLISPGGGSYGVLNGGITNTIETGQAFFVHATTAGSISFTEAAKTTGNNNVYLPVDVNEKLIVNLYNTGVSELMDGTLILYNNNYNDSVNSDDAGKLLNFGLNLSVLHNGKELAIEKRHTINISDTVRLNMSGLIQQQYQLEIIATNLDHPALFGYLKDNYLHTITAINLNASTLLSFSANADSASISASRFMIIFSPVSSLPITFKKVTSESGRRNIKVTWITTIDPGLEKFEVERSSDGVFFYKLATISSAATNRGIYEWKDEAPLPANNFYRIKAIVGNAGSIYSKVVEAATLNTDHRVIVYEVTPGSRALKIKLNMPSGVYNISIYNNQGQRVIYGKYHYQSNCITTILTAVLAKGIYYIKVADEKNNASTTIIL